MEEIKTISQERHGKLLTEIGQTLKFKKCCNKSFDRFKEKSKQERFEDLNQIIMNLHIGVETGVVAKEAGKTVASLGWKRLMPFLAAANHVTDVAISLSFYLSPMHSTPYIPFSKP